MTRTLPVGDGVTVRGLIAGYGTQTVVHGLDLHIDPGEVVALLGPNGAGKTTTLLALAGVIDSSGEVFLGGQPADGPLHVRARDGMAYIPESRSIVRALTVAENIELVGCDVGQALSISPELESLLDRKAATLSGGEQQILSLTQAIARKPRIILADELSFGLAPIVVSRMLELARRAADEGAAVLLVEQFARQVLRIADRAYVLSRGDIITAGGAPYLLDNIDAVEASYLGGEPLRSEESTTASE